MYASLMHNHKKMIKTYIKIHKKRYMNVDKIIFLSLNLNE